jgi:hypothetical protein
MTTMQTATDKEQEVAQFIARKCKQFLTNISRYEREPNGQYRWAYQGSKHLIRMTSGEYDKFSQMGLNEDTSYRPFTLKINGRVIGTVTIWNPYAYPSQFMTIDFVEEMQYKPEVILRFAQYAGMNTKNVDKALLKVNHTPVFDDEMLVY